MNISDRTINAIQRVTTQFQQSENSALKYTWNYAALLQSDTITTSTFSSPSSQVTIASPTNTTITATATISGEPGTHKIVNKIVTAAGNTEERIICLHILSNDSTNSGEDYQ